MGITRSQSYEAVCLVCYSQRSPKTSKRQAEIWATGHMNAYGHRVTIQYH